MLALGLLRCPCLLRPPRHLRHRHQILQLRHSQVSEPDQLQTEQSLAEPLCQQPHPHRRPEPPAVLAHRLPAQPSCVLLKPQDPLLPPLHTVLHRSSSLHPPLLRHPLPRQKRPPDLADQGRRSVHLWCHHLLRSIRRGTKGAQPPPQRPQSS